MFGQTPTEKRTARKFHPKLKMHLNSVGGVCHAIKLKRCPVARKTRLDELVRVPVRDITQVFEPNAMLAICHAIEDLAAEAGHGELIATFQHFDNFEPAKNRYINLARGLDAVRVWGAGEPPKKCPGIDFIVLDDSKIMKYWLVLYDGPEDHAVLLGKQINRATDLKKRKFIGFYSFNPYLVRSIRWRFNLLSTGLSKMVNHWDRSHIFPDLKLQDLMVFMQGQVDK